MGEYWSGLPCPPPGDLHPARDGTLLSLPALAGGFFTTSTTWEARVNTYNILKISVSGTPHFSCREHTLLFPRPLSACVRCWGHPALLSRRWTVTLRQHDRCPLQEVCRTRPKSPDGHSKYLELFQRQPAAVHALLDETQNCDDIAMNFIIAKHTGKTSGVFVKPVNIANLEKETTGGYSGPCFRGGCSFKHQP